jgi:CTP synthase
MELLNIWAGEPRLEDWERVVERWKNPTGEVTIAIVGKYVNLKESYKSLNEALTHGGIAHQVRVHHRYVDSEEVERQGAEAMLKGVDGILVPGGFGSRGVEGKIAAVRYARENRIPFFGICLGMQVATIEFARNVCELEDATSEEFDPQAEHKVVALMPDQVGILDKGGTMRLGAWPCVLQPESLVRRIYETDRVSERHRHRYEIANAYRPLLADRGMVFSGTSPDGRLVEMLELADHPWFVACQFHPDVKSRPTRPHPLFREFVRAAHENRRRRQETAPTEETATGAERVREQQEVAT